MTPAIPDPTHDVDPASGTRAESRSIPQPSAVPSPLAPDGEASALLGSGADVYPGQSFVLAAMFALAHGVITAEQAEEIKQAVPTTLTARTAALAEAEARADELRKLLQAEMDVSRLRKVYKEQAEARGEWNAERVQSFARAVAECIQTARDLPDGRVAVSGDEYVQLCAVYGGAALASASPEPTTESEA